MDTKSKNPKLRLLIIFLILAILPGIATASLPGFDRYAKDNDGFFEDNTWIYRELGQINYVLAALAEGEAENTDSITQYYYPSSAYDSNLYWQTFNEVDNWFSRYNSRLWGMEYMAKSDDGKSVGRVPSQLEELMEQAVSGSVDSELWEKIMPEYDFVAVIRYMEDGRVYIPTVYGASSSDMSYITKGNPTEQQDSDFPRLEKSPRSMTILYAMPTSSVLEATTWYGGTYPAIKARYDQGRIMGSGFEIIFGAILVIGIVLGLLLALTSFIEIKFLKKFPVEILIALSIILCMSWQPIVILTHLAGVGYVSFGYGWLTFEITGLGAKVLCYGLCYLIMLALCYIPFFTAYSLGTMPKRGIKAYVSEASLTYRICKIILRPCYKFLKVAGRKTKSAFKKFGAWVQSFDFSDPSMKPVARFLIINFIVVSVLCCMWFFGIIGLIVYSVLLYNFLKKFYKKQQEKFSRILYITREMANGRLDVRVDEDLGIFAPIGDELSKIQDGFKSAVAAETKSQNMKTELITNVSHDLKTPLTAIITFVDLLKDEDISDEERRKYVDTLDRKSQRLKRLIEDLFDISKASSGNETVRLGRLDLKSIIQQVELDAQDEINASGIDFRHSFPEERVTVALDGEKSSRIFENLILNVTKYALPGTRAYIDMKTTEYDAVVEIKNISKQELSFDTDDITDRFVRGDKSRNTQGSGLGLAIAKSFTELQGGSMEVITDGDLFKVRLSFPLDKAEDE